MTCLLDLPKEVQLKIAMKLFENHTSNAWEIKINGLKVTIKLKAHDIWMDQESEMNSLQWFYLH